MASSGISFDRSRPPSVPSFQNLMNTALNSLPEAPTIDVGGTQRQIGNQISNVQNQTFSTINQLRLTQGEQLSGLDSVQEEVSLLFERGLGQIESGMADIKAEVGGAKIDIDSLKNLVTDAQDKFRSGVEVQLEREQELAVQELKAYQATDVESRGAVRFSTARRVQNTLFRTANELMEKAGLDEVNAVADLILKGESVNAQLSSTLVSAIAHMATSGAQLFLQHAGFVNSNIDRKLQFVAQMSNTIANVAVAGNNATVQLTGQAVGLEGSKIGALAQIHNADVQGAANVFSAVMGFESNRLANYTKLRTAGLAETGATRRANIQAGVQNNQIASSRQTANAEAAMRLSLNDQTIQSDIAKGVADREAGAALGRQEAEIATIEADAAEAGRDDARQTQEEGKPKTERQFPGAGTGTITVDGVTETIG